MKKPSSTTIESLMRKRPFTVCMMVFMLIAEWLFFQFVSAIETGDTSNCFADCRFLIPTVALLVFMLICLVTRCVKIDIRVFKQLVTGTYGFSFWSLAGLMVFILEMSWLCDVTLEMLLRPLQSAEILWNLCKLADILFSMFLLIFFLHLWIVPKVMSLSERCLLLTPISLNKGKVFSEYNLELFLKPLTEDILAINEEDNGKLDNLKEVVILLPAGFDEAEIAPELIKKYGARDNNREFLKDVIINEYDRKPQVNYIDGVNYNSFDSCYKSIELALKKCHSGAPSAVLFISPGTAVMSASLSIFSIPEDRLLIYVNQSTMRLEVVEVDVNTTSVVMQACQSELNA